MSWFEALILGIVQGLTEFLPVSSSGHLEIGQVLLGSSGEENLTFAIIVHAATVLSTLVILWYEVVRLFKGTFSTWKWNAEKNELSVPRLVGDSTVWLIETATRFRPGHQPRLRE